MAHFSVKQFTIYSPYSIQKISKLSFCAMFHKHSSHRKTSTETSRVKSDLNHGDLKPCISLSFSDSGY